MDKEHHKAHHRHHEEHHEYEHHHHGRAGRWLKGFTVGALSGLVASLLMAPRSGEETRELLRYKSAQLKGMAEQAATEARDKARQLRVDAGVQMEALRQRSRHYVEEQRERATRVAGAVSQAARESWEESGADAPEGQASAQRGSETEPARRL